MGRAGRCIHKQHHLIIESRSLKRLGTGYWSAFISHNLCSQKSLLIIKLWRLIVTDKIRDEVRLNWGLKVKLVVAYDEGLSWNEMSGNISQYKSSTELNKYVFLFVCVFILMIDIWARLWEKDKSVQLSTSSHLNWSLGIFPAFSRYCCFFFGPSFSHKMAVYLFFFPPAWTGKNLVFLLWSFKWTKHPWRRT